MTLTRLVFAWLPVAVWFVVAPPLGYRGDAAGGRRYLVWAYNRRAVTGRLLEAVVVTLLGSLWFDSLGSGGWWLLFLLIGLLVAYPLRWFFVLFYPVNWLLNSASLWLLRRLGLETAQESDRLVAQQREPMLGDAAQFSMCDVMSHGIPEGGPSPLPPSLVVSPDVCPKP